MQCQQCSTENIEGSRFCKQCGAALGGDSSKRDKVMAQESSSGKWVVLAVVLVAVLAAGGLIFFKSGSGSNPAVSAGSYTPITAQDGVVKIPVTTVNDGKAHYFTFMAGGKSINFFVLQSEDGVIRAAFDACDVCYSHKKGYRQEGGEMVCNQCDQRFPAEKINEVKGGCNPGPLERRIEGDILVITQEAILSGAWYF